MRRARELQCSATAPIANWSDRVRSAGRSRGLPAGHAFLPPPPACRICRPRRGRGRVRPARRRRRATMTARCRTTSTARASSIRTASPPKSLATLLRWYCGREKAEWPAWAPSPYSDRPPRARRRAGMAPLLCRPRQLAAADRGPEHPDRSGVGGARLAGELRSGRSASTIRASRSTRCRRSTSCWSRTATTTISTSRRCRGSPRSSIARVITPLGNDTIMQEP